MSKKYKLIRKYPSLPKTMEVGFRIEWNKEMDRYHHALTLDLFSKADVENFPSCWEEVKSYYEIRYDSSTPVKILGVIRVNDKVVFTIGDRIEPSVFVRDRKYTTIDKIYFNEHNQLSYSTEKGSLPKTFPFGQDTTHYKAPIFTTEDGVEIMSEEEKFYMVSYKLLLQSRYEGMLGGCNLTYDYFTYKDMTELKGGSKYFSTKAAAEQYILMNKKCISINNLLDLLTPVNKVSELDPRLISFVKKQVGQK